jgi:hypothetical protein
MLDRKFEMGSEEEAGTCLLDKVVRTKASLKVEIRSESWWRKSVTEAVAATGSERVEGSPKPGNDVSSTFIVVEAIMMREQLYCARRQTGKLDKCGFEMPLFYGLKLRSSRETE